MINKIHFGRRISALRRKAGFSQAELAEKLGVTAQAVSKWECGTAMPDIDLLLELSLLYHITINEMLEEADMIYELTGHKADADGIAYFTSKSESNRNIVWANEIEQGEWIRRNWEKAQNTVSTMDAVGQKIASIGGVIVEIGAGPGGGYMPYILKADADSVVIVSDISPTVVREWKVHLDKAIASPNLSYAVFNFCQMPFPNNSIDVISDGGGIGNCENGSKSQALKEAYRVLKPGGVLITSTGFVNKDTLAALEADVQRILLEKRPDIFEDLYEDTVLAGFHQIDSMIDGGWYTEDDDSQIADLARSLGVNLKFTSYIRYCVKP